MIDNIHLLREEVTGDKIACGSSAIHPIGRYEKSPCRVKSFLLARAAERSVPGRMISKEANWDGEAKTKLYCRTIQFGTFALCGYDFPST